MKNIISWFDIPTHDFDRAIKFYSAILGEEIKISEYMQQKIGIFAVDDNTGIGGDIIPPSIVNNPSPDGTRIYLNCDGKLDEVLSRVEKAGGKILQPKFSIGESGLIAIIFDTEGNTIGLHSPNQSQSNQDSSVANPEANQQNQESTEPPQETEPREETLEPTLEAENNK